MRDTINKAKSRKKLENPLIMHIDRGSQYISSNIQSNKEMVNVTKKLEKGL